MNALSQLYSCIRKVHYKIVDVDYTIENCKELIHENGASCTPKHIVLAEQIRALGYEIRYCVHVFDWSDFELLFPKKCRSFLKHFSIDYHTNLEVNIDNSWILVDATWDDTLLDAGLPGTKI